jgi:hypothetical protein
MATEAKREKKKQKQKNKKKTKEEGRKRSVFSLQCTDGNGDKKQGKLPDQAHNQCPTLSKQVSQSPEKIKPYISSHQKLLVLHTLNPSTFNPDPKF